MAAEEERAYREMHRYDSYENRTMTDRCLGTSLAGPPMRSGAYNNNVMIFQTRDHVVIQNEMASQARVIPLRDTAKPPFAQLKGVSRGHWDGETLVVETTQFRSDSGMTGPNMHPCVRSIHWTKKRKSRNMVKMSMCQKQIQLQILGRD